MTAGIVMLHWKLLFFFVGHLKLPCSKWTVVQVKWGSNCVILLCAHLHCHLSIFVSEYFKCDYYLMDCQLWHWLSWWKGCILVASRQGPSPLLTWPLQRGCCRILWPWGNRHATVSQVLTHICRTPSFTSPGTHSFVVTISTEWTAANSMQCSS
jgi:hypothetical protein